MSSATQARRLCSLCSITNTRGLVHFHRMEGTAALSLAFLLLSSCLTGLNGDDICTQECLADTYLECPTFVDFNHCENCCTIKPSDCSLKYENGTVACKGEGGFCPLFCLEDTVVQCGDVFYTDRCENCCTVQFTNCAIRHACNNTIICQGIGFKPWDRK